MEINRFGKINNNPEKNNEQIENKKSSPEQKIAEANSLNALGIQGKAMVNMSFKGNVNGIPPANDVKELTDEEFEQKLSELKPIYDKLPDDIKKCINFDRLTKFNIFVAERIFSNKQFIENENIMRDWSYGGSHSYNRASEIINLSHDMQMQKRLCSIIDKLLSDERIYDNKSVKEEMGNIIYYETRSDENLEAKCNFIDYILAPQNKKLKETTGINKKLGNIIYHCNSPEMVDRTISILNKIKSNEKLYDNKFLMDGLDKTILYSMSSNKELDMLEETLDFMGNDENFYNNVNLKQHSTSLSYIKDMDTLNFLKKIAKNKNIKSIPNTGELLKEIVCIGSSPAKEIFLDKIFSNKWLCINMTAYSLGKTIRKIDTEESANAKAKVIDKIINENKLLKDINLPVNMDCICENIQTKDDADELIELFDLIIENETLCNENIMRAAASNNNKEKSNAKETFLKEIISNKTINQNPYIMELVPAMLYNIGNKDFISINKEEKHFTPEECKQIILDRVRKGIPDTLLQLKGVKLTNHDKINLLFEDDENLEKILSAISTGAFKTQSAAITSPIIITQENSKEDTEIYKFLHNGEYKNTVNSINQVNYRNEMMQILNPDKIPVFTSYNLLTGNIDIEEIKGGLNNLFKTKSPFNQAMKNPKTFVSDPENNLNEEQARVEMVKFFGKNISPLLRMANYLDNDTITQMMNKHTELFEIQMNELDTLTKDNYKLLSELIKCNRASDNKQLSAKEKIELSKIVLNYQTADIDTKELSEISKTGKIDLAKEKEKLTLAFFKKIGLKDDELEQIKSTHPERLCINEDYGFKLLAICSKKLSPEEINKFHENIKSVRNSDKDSISKILEDLDDYEEQKKSEHLKSRIKIIKDFCKHPNKYTDDEIIDCYKLLYGTEDEKEAYLDVIISSIRNDFKEYITDESNVYGQANAQTKKEFEAAKSDYNKWLNPDIADVKFNTANKDMTIKLWDRKPQEDAFMGNKTTCCTATDGENSGATPIYLLNTAFNVIELFDDKTGEMYGMSRVYMANVDGEPSLMMDNIELNNTYTKNMSEEDKKEIRNKFFEYAKNYAKEVTKKETPKVYFSTSYTNVDITDLKEVTKKADFIGKLSYEYIYINAAEDWEEIEEFRNSDTNWYEVPNK